MEARRAFAISYAVLTSLFNIILYMLNESSPDVYVLFNIISYYLMYLIYLRGMRATLATRAINAIFALILIILIFFRIYKVINS